MGEVVDGEACEGWLCWMKVLRSLVDEIVVNVASAHATMIYLQTIVGARVSEPFQASHTLFFLGEDDSFVVSYTQCPHSKIAPGGD